MGKWMWFSNFTDIFRWVLNETVVKIIVQVFKTIEFELSCGHFVDQEIINTKQEELH